MKFAANNQCGSCCEIFEYDACKESKGKDRFNQVEYESTEGFLIAVGHGVYLYHSNDKA